MKRISFTWEVAEGAEAPWERVEEGGAAWISACWPCSGLTRKASEAAGGFLWSWGGGRGGQRYSALAGLLRVLDKKSSIASYLC